MAFIFTITRELRITAWIKNLAIFASIIFTGQLFNTELMLNTLVGFIVFCLISSSTYIINDISDLAYDRNHPIKKYRPLAQGVISTPFAIFLASLLAGSGFYIAASISNAFLMLALIFFLLQFLYSFVLKHMAILDILVIATGYFLRVLAGEFVTSFHTSAWLILTAICLSLFLAIGKRRAELSLLSATSYSKIRKSLNHYSEKLLDEYLSIFATSTFLSYSLFTFLDKTTAEKFGQYTFYPEFLPTYLDRKWLMLTIPFVVFGLMRYMQDMYEKKLGERPEKVIWTDKLLLLDVVAWILSIIFIIYFLPFG